MPLPFEAEPSELEADLESHVDAVFNALQSEFMTLPKGPDFVEYRVFAEAYEELKRVSGGFREVQPELFVAAVSRLPVALIVLRTMLGLTPSEWAYLTGRRAGVLIPQGAARSLERMARRAQLTGQALQGRLTSERLTALVTTACQLLSEGAPAVEPGKLSRLAKADTEEGLASVRRAAELGLPYPMLLYERFLGRPFAGHRDSVSELVGDLLESAVEKVLADSGVSFRKTRRAERLPGFDQAPDFVIPDEYNPRVVIEAKLADDDGTARDKVTRIQHLAQLSADRAQTGAPAFEVIACIAGRGFGVRRSDMRKLLLATGGKVFTLSQLNRIMDCSQLASYRTLRA